MNAVAACRIIDKYVGYGSDDLSVLDDRASAHPLNDSAGSFQQFRICHFQHHSLCRREFLRRGADDFNIKFLYFIVFNNRQHLRRSFFHFI